MVALTSGASAQASSLPQPIANRQRSAKAVSVIKPAEGREDMGMSDLVESVFIDPRF